MKVLWFTNTPSLYTEKLNGQTVLGGWIPSMEQMFRDRNINLRIAFYHDVDKLFIDTHKGNTYYLIPNLNTRTKLVRLKNRWLAKILKLESVLPYFLEIIDDYKPDLVHIWGSEELFGMVIPHLKVPHILHIQGNRNAYYQMYYRGFSKLELNRALSFKDWFKHENFFYLIRKFEKEMEYERAIFKHCKNFFGRTDWDNRITKILSPGSNYIHCDEILRDIFYTADWKSNYNGKTIKMISVFRDSIFKGIETVFDVANLLKNHGIDFSWEIVGVDAKSKSIEVLEKNRTYSIEDLPINFYGFVDAKSLVSIYNKCDLFIHTSHIDNSPNSVCEAMLLGIPVISTNVGGIPSIIEDKETGLLVQDSDCIALAGTIIEVAENYDQARQRATKAKSVAQKRHHKETIYNTVVDTYKKLLNN